MEQHNFNFKKALQTTLKEIKNTKKFKGIRVSCAGRLNKNARGKTEWFKYGQVSLTTINDNIK